LIGRYHATPGWPRTFAEAPIIVRLPPKSAPIARDHQRTLPPQFLLQVPDDRDERRRVGNVIDKARRARRPKQQHRGHRNAAPEISAIASATSSSMPTLESSNDDEQADEEHDRRPFDLPSER
jgi:hypothetical protein